VVAPARAHVLLETVALGAYQGAAPSGVGHGQACRYPYGDQVRHYGAIGGELAAVARLARKLESAGGGPLVFVYEAGPCGFGLYRMLRERGHECWVVSPGLTPRSNADRVKTDRRDSLKLCRGLARAGELTPIHVPDALDEAMRDLVRTREDAVAMQHQARQRLGALLLRNDIRYAGKTAWTPAHRRWQPVVAALQAFRGIQMIHAVRIVAELGDLPRFHSARCLMAFLGLVPSEHSPGQHRQRGSDHQGGQLLGAPRARGGGLATKKSQECGQLDKLMFVRR